MPRTCAAAAPSRRPAPTAAARSRIAPVCPSRNSTFRVVLAQVLNLRDLAPAIQERLFPAGQRDENGGSGLLQGLCKPSVRTILPELCVRTGTGAAAGAKGDGAAGELFR